MMSTQPCLSECKHPKHPVVLAEPQDCEDQNHMLNSKKHGPSCIPSDDKIMNTANIGFVREHTFLLRDKNTISNSNSNARKNHYAYGSEDPPLNFLPTSNGSGGSTNSINYSSNALLTFRLQEMRESEHFNFLLATFCLIYCAINVTLIYVNYINCHAPQDEPLPVSDYSYHLIEFWGTFGFALVECASLVISTPKSLLRIYNNPLLLKLILFFNVVATLVPALMVTLNLEEFEIISHEIEYLNELTMTFVDMVLLLSLFGVGPSDDDQSSKVVKDDGSNNRNKLIMTCTSGLVALIQLSVYNGMGRTDDGDMMGEVPAHYLEFVFESLSSMIVFWFCMDNKFIAAKEIGLILYGSHSQCNICDAKSDEFLRTYNQLDRRSIV